MRRLVWPRSYRMPVFLRESWVAISWHLLFRLGLKERGQGFGSGKNEPSHYWVSLPETLVDLGPHYLPRGSSFEAQEIPFVAWSPAQALPKFLRYRPEIEYHPSGVLQSTPEIVARMEAFLAKCRARFAEQRGQPKLPTWVLTGEASLRDAASRGSGWARNAIRFSTGIQDDQLPF
ncbi:MULTISPECIES: hypothetical protein [unclassified Bradyrhizobium]|uniref:hypothetical protein n=1 Tax=unclassified Bradyrhizobium TaxID=2631580 RepID=UPI001FF9C7BF|nr:MULTISPECIES: hypothetical protein [unclassified Bradyrhizobium]MCK1582428.1 hypothetical protein [Bradyrhizobium sp. 168]MCK1590210.1 hypothetical protein [Bradyrhizobium sp. 169]MCK1698379.1 hypothetical protein [Bradyrhizobium sp. 144]UPJ31792.1 hypothetical protein IVB54_39350 [Bradyrhizobium sp. CW1]